MLVLRRTLSLYTRVSVTFQSTEKVLQKGTGLQEVKGRTSGEGSRYFKSCAVM